MRTYISLLALVLSFNTFAESFDKTEELNGVTLKSRKEDAVRTFVGSTEKTFSFPVELVKKGITNFTEKCNNDYKSKRKFTDEKIDCKYHNDHLVESIVIKDIRQMDHFKHLSEVYIVGRQVYNRGAFGYYEMVSVEDKLNDKKQKLSIIRLRMLDDEEVRLFTSPKFAKESAFDKSYATFTLTEIAPNTTHMTYEYSAETDHWLLNKEVSVPQVFASISKSINDLVITVEAESSFQKRELASKE
jgi:hypothetical protein